MHEYLFPSKLFFLTSCLFAVFAFAAYTAVMTSTMVSLPVLPAVKNFDQLIEQHGSKLKLGTWFGAVSHEFLKLAPVGTPLYRAHQHLLEGVKTCLLACYLMYYKKTIHTLV